MGGLVDTKSRLRRELIARRCVLSADELARASRAVCAQVAAATDYRNARVLVMYAARNGEVDPESLGTRADGIVETYYPIVEGDSLAFRRADVADLRQGTFGIPEPPSTAPRLEPGRSDVLILVPGIAFDIEGGRLGTGRGFYDRALVAYPLAHRFGIGLAAFVVRKLPVDPWDVVMHAVATEHEIIRADAYAGAHPGDT
jgi:5-formyltetrahydrofolate cyclo-ligase